MICKMCGYKEASSNGELCDKCLKESIEDTIKINTWIADGHPRHCACRLVWGDGECECMRNQNWLTPKPTMILNGKDLVNFDCPELHDYDKEEALLYIHNFFNNLNKLKTDLFEKTILKQEYLGKEFTDVLHSNLDKLYET